MSNEFLEIQDPVVSSFYDKLESCYDKTDDYLKERVKSDELVEESNLMRKNILDYITSSEIATLGEAHYDSQNSNLVEVSVAETPAVTVAETSAATVSSPGTTAPPAATTSSSDSSVTDSSATDSSVTSSESQSSSSEEEDNVPTKKQKLNEEHDSAYEESFDSRSDEVSIVDVIRKV